MIGVVGEAYTILTLEVSLYLKIFNLTGIAGGYLFLSHSSIGTSAKATMQMVCKIANKGASAHINYLKILDFTNWHNFCNVISV